MASQPPHTQSSEQLCGQSGIWSISCTHSLCHLCTGSSQEHSSHRWRSVMVCTETPRSFLGHRTHTRSTPCLWGSVWSSGLPCNPHRPCHWYPHMLWQCLAPARRSGKGDTPRGALCCLRRFQGNTGHPPSPRGTVLNRGKETDKRYSDSGCCT